VVKLLLGREAYPWYVGLSQEQFWPERAGQMGQLLRHGALAAINYFWFLGL
jgi:hypothetical protein